MKDKNKTKDQLIVELAKFRRRFVKLEESKTKQKQAEKALRESEGRYREMIEKAGIAILIDDEEGNIKYANKKAAELYGYSLEEMNDQSVRSLVHPDDFKRVTKFHKARIQGKRIPSSYVFKGVRKDGAVRYFELIAAPDKKEESIIGTRLYIKDVTEQKRAVEKLRESEAHYRGLADSISDVFFEMDKDIKYVYWNKASEDLTGITAKDAIGKSLFEIFPDIKGTEVEKKYIEVLRTQQPQTFVNEYQLKGKSFFFEISAYPSRSGLSVFVKDITERKKAEEQIKASLKEKDVLLKEIHHRVKNNMQIISSILNLQSGVIKHKRTLELFKSSQSRIKSMALIHEKLYKSKDFDRIDFFKYVQSLSKDLFRVYGINQDVVK